MKNLLFRTLFTLIIFCVSLFAQDPGTVISINLINGSKKVSSINIQDYIITVHMVKPYHAMYDEKHDLTGDSALFHFFDWVPYRGEIYEIKIAHSTDTMIIRFQMNLDSTNSYKIGNEYYVWNAYFYLEIAVQSGYFEITDFTEVKHSGYKINNAFVWLPLDSENRKLH